MLKVYYDDVDLLRILTPIKDLSELEDTENLKLVGIHKNDPVYEHVFNTKPLEVGSSIEYKGQTYPVIFRGIVKKDEFLKQFDATKERMGAYVEDNKTTFAVYSPVASSISVVMDDKEYPMLKKDNGVYHITLDFNAHGLDYLYKVNVYGEEKMSTDPYAIASGPNRSSSTVVDLNKLNFDIAPLNQKDDPIILEASVRDFSMDPKVPFEHRGKFLGMLESHGDYGMKHVTDLGITHLQLMPVNDFETVDELNPFEKYNWGYDTMQFLSLEGSYSTNVHDPLQAMKDFATLVDGYHKENIGINIDVVFNHIYEVEDHPFNVLFPYYYFRYNEDFSLSNGSFCGNEIASEMPMTRKIIVDTCKHFVKTYKVDGFRFDLMGLLDVDTMNQVVKTCQAINPDVMVYGEGWSMPTVLPEYMQASMNNYFQMPQIAHFNDKFRDGVAGDLNDEDLGYAGGDLTHTECIKAALSGYSDISYACHVFSKSSQSVNYVECHDNMTVADKVALGDNGEEEALFMMGMVLFAQGIPFLQIGQSFFRDKQGDENSYKSPDTVNRINWSMLDEHKKMNDTVKSWIKLRKEMYKIKEGYSFKQERDLLHYYYGTYEVIFNPSDKDDIVKAKEVKIIKH